MTPYDRIHLGMKAGHFLEDQAFEAAVTHVKDELWRSFADSTTSAERDQIHARLWALTYVVNALHSIRNDGTETRNRI